jgi:GTP-binding protein
MHPTIVSGSDPIFNDGLHVAFFGRSNVGKSSTINRLLNNKKAAKVSTTPGKTVTFNFYNISADDDTRYLVDLPGYGYAKHGRAFREKLRRRLIWYINESGARIEKFCLVLDAKAGLTDIDRSAIDLASQASIEICLLVNKIDRLNQKQLSALKREIEHEPKLDLIKILYYSAKTGKGIDPIKEYLQLI